MYQTGAAVQTPSKRTQNNILERSLCREAHTKKMYDNVLEEMKTAGEVAHSTGPTGVLKAGELLFSEAKEHVGDNGGVSIATSESSDHADAEDVATEHDPSFTSTAAAFGPPLSECSDDSDETVKGDYQVRLTYGFTPDSSLKQEGPGNKLESSPHVIVGVKSNRGDSVSSNQTHSLPPASYLSLNDPLCSQDAIYGAGSPSTTGHHSQQSLMGIMSQANDTQRKNDSPATPLQDSRSIRFISSSDTTSTHVRTPLHLPPSERTSRILQAMHSPVPALRDNITPSPTLRHHRSISNKPVPFPLGPGNAAKDCGSGTPGLIGTPTIGSSARDDSDINFPSTTGRVSTNSRGQRAPPSTPTNSLSSSIVQNRYPPYPGGRSTGVSNLPFIAVTPSAVAQARSSGHHRYASIDEILNSSSQEQNIDALFRAPPILRGSSQGTGTLHQSSGSDSPTPLRPQSPMPGPHCTTSSSMHRGRGSGHRPQSQLNNLYAGEDPFIDDQAASASASSSTLPSSFPVHNTNTREAIRATWIRTQAARIASLARTMRALQGKLDMNPAGFTVSDMQAYDTTRAQLQEACNLDAQLESRRSLFMPAGRTPLRTLVAEDGFQGTAAVASGIHMQPNHPNSDGNAAHSSSRMNLLGFRMALMERQGHVVVANRDAETSTGWSRILDGLDEEGRRGVRGRAADAIRGATARRMERGRGG